MRRILVLFVLLCSWLVPVNFTAHAQGLTPTEIERIAQSVVLIATLDGRFVLGTGSGTIVSPTGQIFTNSHVIEGGTDYEIYVLDDINEQPVFRYYASVERTFRDMDFAVLQIDRDANGRPINPNTLNLPYIDPHENAASQPSRGETIYVFGYPGIGDGYLVFSTGIITTIQNQTVAGERVPAWYQTDAEIAPGNSGGLAVNAAGIPLGIPTIVSAEEETGGRLGGILPFSAVLRLADVNPTQGATAGGRGDSESSGGSLFPSEPSSPFASGVGVPNLNLTCDSGDVISNGTQVTVVQMRSGFTYHATVIGLNGFDPVLMVVNPDGESGYCNDDHHTASLYSVDLPGLGQIAGKSTDARVSFSQNQVGMADMGLVVGGYNGSSGEFLLILEGMAVTDGDAAGDPFAVLLTQSLIESGVPLEVFMLGHASDLDPLIMAVNDAADDLLYDADDLPLLCDDAGNLETCWGASASLSNAQINGAQQRVSGDSFDAMLTIEPGEAAGAGYQELTFLMSSYNFESRGHYTVVFHMGVR